MIRTDMVIRHGIVPFMCVECGNPFTNSTEVAAAAVAICTADAI